jgi:hypothetical protein
MFLPLFRFVFASFNFRFASDGKTNKKTLFSHRSEKILLLFRFISFRSENDGSFRFFRLFLLCFIFDPLQISTFRIDAKHAKKALFSHQSEKNFASFSLRSENDGAPYSELLS